MGERTAFYENAQRLRDGAILVYTRPGRKKSTYQVRLKIPGVTGYVVRSLKTTDVNAALTQAEDLFYELRAEQKQGLDIMLAGNLCRSRSGARSSATPR